MKSGRRSPPAPSALPGAETGQRGGPATEDPEQAVLARGWGLAEALLHAPIAVAMFDRNMRYVAVSSRFVSEYRLPPETELIGRSHYDLFPEISPRWVEIHARVLAGESRSADYDPFPRADGSTDYVRWSMSPWIDANGAIGGAFLVSEVVTDRAGVGQDREERYQRAARAVRVAGLGYGDVDYVADRVSLDPEASRLYGFGYQERTLPRSVVHERIPAEDREGLLRVREAAIAPGGDGRFEYEHRVQLDDGSIRWVSTRNQVSFEERPGGRVATRAVLTVFDVTNRARLEEALRESEDFARVALEANPDCIVMLDRAGRVLFVNKAGRRSLGLADGVEVVGEVWRDLWRHSCRASIDSALALALRGSRQRLEVIRDDPDGRETWWEVDLVPASRGESRHGALLAVSRDVSERKRNEAELKVSRNAFQQLIENSPFGILAVDADFRLALVSRGAKQTFRNVHPLLGRDFGEVVRTIWPEPFATEAIEHYRHTLATGEPYHAPSLVERRADTAETESYDWQIERVVLPDGRYGVVCHFYDLSERQRHEEYIGLLMRETTHRSKNLLQLVQAVADNTAARSPADFARKFSRRIQALVSYPIRNLTLVRVLAWMDVCRVRRADIGISVRLTRCADAARGPNPAGWPENRALAALHERAHIL